MNQYVRPYIPGSITPEGFIVVCVPGLQPLEVSAPLAQKVTQMVLEKKYDAARIMLSWFSDEVQDEP